MSFRVSEKAIQELIDRVNRISNNKYRFSSNGYGYGIEIVIPNSTGISTFSYSNGSKKEVYEKLQFLLEWTYHQNQKFTPTNYFIRNCRHRDERNSIDGSQDISLIHEYTNEKTNGKYYRCLSCHKELTEEKFIENSKPITESQLRKELKVLENEVIEN